MSSTMGSIFLMQFPGLNEQKIYSEKTLSSNLLNLKKNKCTTIVSLLEADEISEFCEISFFSNTIRSLGLDWHHLPIIDRDTPDKEFLLNWEMLSSKLRQDLKSGFNICLHCLAGLGRSGTIAALMLIDHGDKQKDAILKVREHRNGAIENEKQENFVKNYQSMASK